MSSYIDRIVRKFDKMAKKLENHAQRSRKLQEETADRAHALQNRAALYGDEADRAVRIKNRIAKLVE